MPQCTEIEQKFQKIVSKSWFISHIFGSASWPPIWDCCGPTEGSFFSHGQIKNPAFFEGRCYTGQMIRQMWAESAVCLNSYL